jgi:PAS domain S-box-containing protein
MCATLSSPRPEGKLTQLQESLASLSSELDALTPEELAQIRSSWNALSGWKKIRNEVDSQRLFPEENPNPVMRFSRDGLLLYANPASQGLLAHFDCQVGLLAADFFKQITQTVGQTAARKTVELECGGLVFSLDVVPIADSGTINIYGRDVTKRWRVTRELQQLLAENERQKTVLDAIFEADPSGLAVLVGEDLRFAFVNPAYRYMIPNPMQDPIDRLYCDVWPNKSKYSNRDRFRTVIQTGQPFQVTGIIHQFPDGSVRVFTLQARRIIWEDQPACLLILWDVSDLENTQRQLLDELQQRKQAEAARRQSEARYRAFFDNLTESIFIVRAVRNERGEIVDLVYLDVNPMACQVLGFECVQLLGRTVREIQGEEISERELSYYRQVLSSPAPVFYQTEFHSRHFFVIVFPIGEDSVAYVSTDVTIHLQAETLLQRYRLLFEVARDILFFVRAADGRILEANHAAEMAYGYSREQLLSLTIADLRAPETRAVIETQMAQANDRGIQFETWHCRADGSTFPVEVSSLGAAYEGQRVLLSIVRDISSRSAAQKERDRLLAENIRQKELLARLVQAAPVGIAFLKGPEHNYTLVNQEFTHFARGKGELIGHTVAEKCPSIADLVIPKLDRVYQTGCSISVSDVLLSDAADRGDKDRYSINLTPIRDLQGSVEGVMVLVFKCSAHFDLDH